MTSNSWLLALLLLLSLPWTIISDFGNSISTATHVALNTLVTDHLPLGDTDYLTFKLLAGRSYRMTLEATTYKNYYFGTPPMNVLSSGVITTSSFSYVPAQTQDFYLVFGSSIGNSGPYNFAVIDETACSASCTGMEVFLWVSE